MNEWLEQNYSRLREITSKICKTNDIEEILHFCINELLNNKKLPQLTSEEKVFFFARIVRNNFYSKTSPYFRAYKRTTSEINDSINIKDEAYEEFDELAWVYQQIEKDKQYGSWYFARLFEIYISQGCSITKTAKKTTIPVNSVSRDVNKYRKILKERRKTRQS